MKEIDFLGDSQDRLRELPEEPRRYLGYNLSRVQGGQEPLNYKTIASVGQGVYELRAKDEQGIYRVFYIAKLGDVVYVLHTFTKKTQQTPLSDIRIGKKRLAEAKDRAAERTRK